MTYLYVGWGRFSIGRFLCSFLSIFTTIKGFICALISGFTNAAANFIIVFAIKLNITSGGSPGAMNCILILNTVIWLVAGIYLFHEKHRYWKYLGGILIFLSIILLTFERSFELPGFHTIDENLKYIYSILLAICSWILWSMTAISGKYAMYYYECDPIEYGNLAMFICGLFGSLTFIYLLVDSTPFGLAEGESFIFTLIRIIFAGIFSVTGYYAYFTAASYGPVEICQLFSNMKSIVQIVEEFLFLNILPSFISSIGKNK